MKEKNNNNKVRPKQLIVVVEGTAAVAPFWQTIISDYLHNIIRCFCASEQTGQVPNSFAELSLIVFTAQGSFSACLVQRSGWTKDADTFFQWLSAIPFLGGGFGDVAIAEGLAEALMMFSCPNGNQNPVMSGQRHCILVAASNPNSLPIQFCNTNIAETLPDNSLSTAETLAQSFSQCSISLSVICPKQLPKLKSIYIAGKQNPRAADLHVVNNKNPHFLVLLSENFMEGRAALSCSSSGGGATVTSKLNPIDLDMTSSAPPVPSGMGPNQNMMDGHISDSSSISVTNMLLNKHSSNALNLQTDLQLQKSDYSKVWEGSLYGKRRGQHVFVTRMEGYMKLPASENLTEKWPTMMVIDRLVSDDYFRQHCGKFLVFVFQAMTQHGFLNELQERKLCAVIQLPSQRLLLSVTEKVCRLVGVFLPEDIRFTLKPRIPDSQQMQAQLLQLQAKEQQLQVQLQQMQAQYLQGQLLGQQQQLQAQQQLQTQQEQLSTQRQQLEAMWQQLQAQQQVQQNRQCSAIKQEE